jgi:hypothetical protein
MVGIAEQGRAFGAQLDHRGDDRSVVELATVAGAIQ